MEAEALLQVINFNEGDAGPAVFSADDRGVVAWRERADDGRVPAR